ncbi:MAG: hypothetical protein ACYTF7_07510 [Planctomycetota bacterium]|jgi:hypothetical protein
MTRIVRRLAILTLASLAILSLSSAHADHHDEPYDLSTVQSTIDALYDVISGPAGQERNWDAFRSLFAENAHLRTIRRPQDGQTSLFTMTVEDYIERGGAFLEENGFFESELSSTSESFGHVTHVFSTYQSKHHADDPEPFARGINSIQLYTDGTRWYVISIVWDTERQGQPIPEHYLP